MLADVAGTIPAKEAVYDAQIPQMAEVDRAQTTTQVDYDGDPQFEPIGTTGMEYAANTSTAVIRVYGRYYDCDQGVWFESATPFGPWDVCINVPEIIYTIPPNCPIYGVRYVRVYTYTPEIAYVGYTAGYTGCYVYGRTVVYGTGYNYHPWYKHSYYARPWTWGLNVHYDPWAGWSFNAGWGQPHGWFIHHPKVTHAGWWGPAKYHPVYRPVTTPIYRAGYHPVYHPVAVRTSNSGRRTSNIPRPATLYDQRGTSIRRPAANGIVQPIRVETQRTQPSLPTVNRPITPTVQRPEQRPAAMPVPRIETRTSTRENNVYAAPDGSIMRSTPQGWQQRNQNTWKQAPETPAKQATVHDSEVRQRATERTSSFKPSPSSQPAPRSTNAKDDKRR